MPGSPESGDAGGPKPPLLDRLKSALLKPGTAKASDHIPTDEAMSPEELEHAVQFVSDKERLIGLIAAPIAALLDILVVRTLDTHDPAQFLRNGNLDKNYVNPSEYHVLFFVLLGVALGMLASAWWRKRMPLGIATALFGLGLFNLHYWGFGVPFIFVAAWYLVRAYRLQRAYKLAVPDGSLGGSSSAATAGPPPDPAAPPPRGGAKAGRRYTAR